MKVKAHAVDKDVAEGLISDEEKHGNHLADYWAKKGSWLEPPPKAALLVLEGCRAVAHEAIRSGAKLGAFLVDSEHFDSEGIIGVGHYVLDVEDEPEEGLWASRSPQALEVHPSQNLGPWRLHGHTS